MKTSTKSKLEAFLRDLQKICAKHDVTLIPQGDFGEGDGGCGLTVGEEADFEFCGASATEASAWHVDDEKPTVVS